MKKRFIFLLTVLVALAVLIFTVTRREEARNLKSKSDSPTLVVGIVVDQMRYDYLYRYWENYTDDGFKRIINNGFSCENHHFSYIPTYTGPGHASVYSGTTPNVHGIIANDWHIKGTDSSMYCAEDQSVNPIGTDNVMERRSPRNIKVTNMSDEIKLAFSYRSKVIGVSIKDRGAILPAGKLADAAYWFTGYEGGKFVSSDYYMENLPAWVDSFNIENQKGILEYVDAGWDLLLDKEAYWQSNPDDSDYENDRDNTDDLVFPYDLKAVQEKDKAEEGDYNVIKVTPYGNEMITEFGLQAVEHEGLGQDKYIDVLALSYSTPDYVGHKWGTRAMETEDMYLRLDRSLAHLMTQLDQKVGEGNYILFLTADHGAAIVPQELIDRKVNIDYFNWDGFQSHVNAIAEENFGSKEIVENISNMQVFLNEAKLEEMALEKDKVEKLMAEKILDFPGVNTTTPAYSLRTGSYQELKETLYKGYNQKMSGHILYTMQPGWISYSRKGTTHGSGYAYDTHVPFLLFGHGIPNGHTHRRTLVEDIAPTITSLIHVQHPMATTGDPVFEVLD